MEYWDFLGCSCDLSKPEGMALLEEFLKSRANSSEVSTEDLESPLPTSGVVGTEGSDGVSCRLFSEEETEEARVLMEEPQVEASPNIDELSELFSKKASLENNLYISG